MMDWLLFYFTTNTAACGGNKKVRLSPHPISHLPPENLWVWLRQSLEKTARMGGVSGKNPNLASFYDQARTYFQRNV
jgi:hypothetical protein